jgi:hypothetical protein
MGFTVSDKFRTNDLSLEPGGVTVVVTYHDGRVLEYPRIKNPAAYIRTMNNNPNVKSATIKQ